MRLEYVQPAEYHSVYRSFTVLLDDVSKPDLKRFTWQVDGLNVLAGERLRGEGFNRERPGRTLEDAEAEAVAAIDAFHASRELLGARERGGNGGIDAPSLGGPAWRRLRELCRADEAAYPQTDLGTGKAEMLATCHNFGITDRHGKPVQ